MRYLFFLFTMLFFSKSNIAQPIYSLTDTSTQKVTAYGVLPNFNYTFQQVCTDTSVHFIPNDSLRPTTANTYWVKILVNNPSKYSEKYSVWVHPQISNTLYYFNANTKQWDSVQAGLTVPNHQRVTGYMPCVLQANSLNALYVKVQVKELQKFPTNLKPKIYLHKVNALQERENFVVTICFSTILIVLAFLLYHLYLYVNFRDKIYLHYITIQVGGIVYILGFWQLFNQLFSVRIVQFKLLANGNLYFYDFNNFLTQLSVLFILFGFIQLTRAYLNTKIQLPQLDNLFRYSIALYVLQSLISSLVTISGFFYLDFYTIFYDNLFVVLLIILILFSAIKAWNSGIIGAKYFFWANIVPLCFMFALAIYFAVFKFHRASIDLLPSFAIVSQAIAFAIAIVWRISLIKEELAITQNEINTLNHQFQQLIQRNAYIELENKYIADEMALHLNQKEALKAKLDANQRELASNTLYILQKNELVNGLQKQINLLAKQQATSAQKQVFKEMKSTLQNSVQLDNDWDKFKLHFEQVHPNFFTELEQKHPNLTPYEIRLSAYLHLQMSAKEIAALLNIDANSVHRAKTRLKKKLESNG